ncbi:hypothetical protein GQ53DRAFT_743747 [Thozetella sp. PMI_491]|nr:hypothetical protein GQ53DRAFT_743747 [Thozetella sp. PMI_491]
MASGLSSNWKALQARIQAESTKSAEKRKATAPPTQVDEKGSRKRQRIGQDPISRKGPAAPVPAKQKGSGKSQMGVAQSSKIDTVAESGVAPSLALWAADNDISAEDVAEAYGLGLSKNSMLKETPGKPNEGLAPGLQLGKYLAIDCEMVGVGENGYEDALARVSVIDFHGRQVYDSYVRPQERVTDWRTHVSGVSPKHMRTAREFDEVQAQIAELLKGRILVGHDVKHDLRALQLDHPFKDMRDTAKYSGFKKYGNGPKPALRVLAQELLGVEIQTGQHSSIEDARVTMLLFRKHKPGFDVEHANRYPDPAKGKPPQGNGKKKKKKP